MKNNIVDSAYKSKILLILPFVLYFIIATYKLANPSFWMGEALEHHYAMSKLEDLNFLVINTSFQPPLYVWILHLWVKINDSVFWIRFLSVLFGFGGAVGFYKAVKEISGQHIALFSVIIYSCVFRFVYYFQEATEYALVLGNICWLTYFFVRVLKKMDIKNIILFNVFAALSFISQYGAAIVIANYVFFILLKVFISKDKRSIVNVLTSFVSNFVLFFIPVYQFFVIHQINLAYNERAVSNLNTDRNILWNFIDGFSRTIRYNLFQNFPENTSEVYMNFHIPNYIVTGLLYAFLMFFVVAVVKILKSRKNIVIISLLKKPASQKDMTILYLIWSSIISWLMLYAIIRSGLYSYGVFGIRWGLFITPVWLITLIVVINEHLSDLRGAYKKSTNKLGHYLTYVVIFLTTIYCLSGVYGVFKHWEKENTKAMVQEWYNIEGYKEKTILYYGAKYGFLYYLKQDKRYNDSTEENIIPMPWLLDGDYYEYKALFEKLLNGELHSPVIYICAAHKSEDIYTILLMFRDKGYKSRVIYDVDDAAIFKLTKDNSEKSRQ